MRTSGISPYVVTVEFEIESGAEAEFMALMLENASESVRSEPGCLRFDVLAPLPPHDAQRVLLYEIYRDRAAFEEHMGSGHFKKFDAAVSSMVRSKSVMECAVWQNAKGSPAPCP